MGEAPEGGESGTSTSRRIARNTAVRASAEIVAKLASVGFYVVMARELGQERFGDFMFALSLSSVLLLVAGFGVDDLITRDAAKDKSRTAQLWSDAVAIKVISGTVLIGSAAIVVNLAGYSSDARTAVYLVGAGNAIEVLTWSWHAVFASRERLDLTAVSVLLQRLSTSMVGIALLLAGYGVAAAGAAFLGGAVLNLMVAHWQLKRHPAPPAFAPDRRRWRVMLIASAPLGAAGLMLTALIKIDTVVLSFLSGGDNTQVGFYSAAYRLVEATLFITWSFAHAMIPLLARSAREAIPDLTALGLKALVFVLTPVGLALMLYAEPVVELFYGSEYDDAVTPLRLLGAMSVAYGTSYFTATVLVARDETPRYIRIGVFVLIQNVVANLVLIPPLGATGAAINAVISGVLLSAVGLYSIAVQSGPFSVIRALGAPVAGAAAATAVVLGLGLPVIPGATLAFLAYLAAALGFERLIFPADAAMAVRTLRNRSLS